MGDDALGRLRARLDEVNASLLDLLNARLRVVDEVRKHKERRGLALADVAREREMLADLIASNTGPLTDDDLRRVFSVLFEVSLNHMRAATQRGTPPDERARDQG